MKFKFVDICVGLLVNGYDHEVQCINEILFGLLFHSTISEKVESTVCIMRCMRRSLIDVLSFDKKPRKSITRSNGKLSSKMQG